MKVKFRIKQFINSLFTKKEVVNDARFERIFDSKSMTIKSTDGKFSATLDLINDNEMGTFYIFRSPLDMPYLRQHLFDKIEQSKNLGYTKADIEDAFTQIQTKCKAPTPSLPQELYHIASTMKEKLKDAWTFSEASMMLAALMIVEKDEDIMLMTDDICSSKLARWKQNPIALSFFLRILQQNMMNITNLFESSIPNFLNHQGEKMESQSQSEQQPLTPLEIPTGLL